ncbi:unnamed protein product [Cunninghamella blakesleeana]
MGENYGIATSTLEETIKIIKELNMTSNHIRVLHNLLNNTLLDALNIIDTQSVIKINCGINNKRTLFLVIDHKNNNDSDNDHDHKDYYLCYLNPRHCPCRSFIYSLICDESILICKHILACILFDALDYNTPKVNMDEEKYAELLYYHSLPSSSPSSSSSS